MCDMSEAQNKGWSDGPVIKFEKPLVYLQYEFAGEESLPG